VAAGENVIIRQGLTPHVRKILAIMEANQITITSIIVRGKLNQVIDLIKEVSAVDFIHEIWRHHRYNMLTELS
jgi:peptidoglycan/xylan/chitin deacetylase (PgdA/CDA1 family)